MNEIQNTIQYLRAWIEDLTLFDDEKESVNNLEKAISVLEKQKEKS